MKVITYFKWELKPLPHFTFNYMLLNALQRIVTFLTTGSKC